MGWIKINSDGFIRGIRSVGCGGVYRDQNGVWIFGFSKYLAKP